MAVYRIYHGVIAVTDQELGIDLRYNYIFFFENGLQAPMNCQFRIFNNFLTR